jgi:hypothetical protein
MVGAAGFPNTAMYGNCMQPTAACQLPRHWGMWVALSPADDPSTCMLLIFAKHTIFLLLAYWNLAVSHRAGGMLSTAIPNDL